MGSIQQIIDNVAAMPADDRRTEVAKLMAEVNALRDALEASPDYQKAMVAKNIEEQRTAIDAFSPGTYQGWTDLRDKQHILKDLFYKLYADGRADNLQAVAIRADMDNVIDRDFIDNPEARLSYWHMLLNRSQQGGRVTNDRPDVQKLAYEFNDANANGGKTAVAFTGIDRLFEKGFLRSLGDSQGNNLTALGVAVLKRLNERFPAGPQPRLNAAPV